MKNLLFVFCFFLLIPTIKGQFFDAFLTNIGGNTNPDHVLDATDYYRLGHGEPGDYGTPFGKWAAIGVPDLNYPPLQQNYYGFFSNWSTDRAFFGLTNDGINRSDALIAFGDNHDGLPDYNRLIFRFESFNNSFSREIATMRHNGNFGLNTANPTATFHIDAVPKPGDNSLLSNVRLENLPTKDGNYLVIDQQGYVYDSNTPIGQNPPCNDTCYWRVDGNNIIGQNNIFGTLTNDDIRIFTDNSERARYTNDGNYRFGIGNSFIGLNNLSSGILGDGSTISNSSSVFALGGNNVIEDSDQSGVFGEDLEMYNSHGSFMGGAHSIISNAWSNGPIDDYNSSIGLGNSITGSSSQAPAIFNGNFGTSNSITGASIAAQNNVNLGDGNTITDGRYNSNRGVSNTNIRSNYSHMLGFRNNIQSTQNSQAIGDNNKIDGSHSSTIRGFNNTMKEARFSHILGNESNIISAAQSFTIGNNNDVVGVSNAFAIGSRISTNVDNTIKFGFNNNRTQTITERGVEIQMDPGNDTYTPVHNLEVMAGSVGSSGTFSVPEIEFRNLPLTNQPYENVVIDPATFEIYRKPGGSGGNVNSSCLTQNLLPKVATSGSPDLVCSQIFDNGVSVGIASTGPFNYFLGSPPFSGGGPPFFGTLKLDVNGIGRFTSLFATSDKTLKTNISKISNANSLISRLHGKTYNWTEEYAKEANLDRGFALWFYCARSRRSNARSSS